MSSGPLEAALSKAIASRKKKAIPTLDLLEPSPLSAPDVFSNDYLSLTINPTLRAAALKKLSETDSILGSSGARVLHGNTSVHVAFESRMREFFGAPAALLCNSGFDANVAFWRSIPQRGDVIIIDELIHASCRDGMADCRAKDALYSFKHNSADSFRDCLVRVLEAHPAIAAGKSTVFIAVEGLYSMDGDFSPLSEIVEITDALVAPSSRHIMVDEAHSTGLFGPQGRGLIAALGLTGRIDTVLHTFGKARAASGAVILTTPIVRQYVINYGRPFIFTTAMPRTAISILNSSFDHIESSAGDEGRERLRRIAEYFRQLLDQALKHVPPNLLSLRARPAPSSFPREIVSPIFPILTQHPNLLATYLCRFGYACTAVPYPAVPRGEERIRIVVHAANQPEELKELVDRMLQWAASMQADKVQPQTPDIRARL